MKSKSLWWAVGAGLFLLAAFFFVKIAFHVVPDFDGAGGEVVPNGTECRVFNHPIAKQTRQSPGTRDFSLPEIVDFIRNVAPGDTTDEEVLAAILEKLNEGIADGTWPRGKVMASIAKMVDDYPKLAFLLMGRVAPDSGGQAYQLSIIRTFASRDPDAALAFLCRHGPVGSRFDSLAHSVVVTLLRKRPGDLMAWLRAHDSHEEELLVRKQASRMLSSFGADDEGLAILDLVLADSGLPEDLRRAALRGRLRGTAERGGAEWMKYVDSMGHDWSDPELVSLVVGFWPDELADDRREFVKRLPPGKGKEIAGSILAGIDSESGRVEDTIGWIREIHDPGLRKEAVQNSTVNIYKNNKRAIMGYLENLPLETDRSAAIDSIFPRLRINGEMEMAKRIAALEPEPKRRQDLLEKIEGMKHPSNPESQ